MYNPHEITKHFEKAVAEYCGAKYFVAIDNCSNAIYLALKYVGVEEKEIEIPSHTYPSCPMEIIRAGGKVKFRESDRILEGAYELGDTKVYDSALRFTADQYIPGTFMCLSFTGPYKIMKLGKAGGILTDNLDAVNWFKKARFSGRGECSYHVENFDDNPVIGGNFYLMPEIAARGILLIQQFYNLDGTKKQNQDLRLPYPNLSTFNIFKT